MKNKYWDWLCVIVMSVVTIWAFFNKLYVASIIMILAILDVTGRDLGTADGSFVVAFSEFKNVKVKSPLNGYQFFIMVLLFLFAYIQDSAVWSLVFYCLGSLIVFVGLLSKRDEELLEK